VGETDFGGAAMQTRQSVSMVRADEVME